MLSYEVLSGTKPYPCPKPHAPLCNGIWYGEAPLRPHTRLKGFAKGNLNSRRKHGRNNKGVIYPAPVYTQGHGISPADTLG